MALAVVCPRLRQLEVSHVPVIGPAFISLAQSAPHLRSLTCWGRSTPHGFTALHNSVAALTQLTSLHLNSLSSPSCAASAGPLLPHISSLHQLQDLYVGVQVTEADDLLHLASLTALTSLHLDMCT